VPFRPPCNVERTKRARRGEGEEEVHPVRLSIRREAHTFVSPRIKIKARRERTISLIEAFNRNETQDTFVLPSLVPTYPAAGMHNARDFGRKSFKFHLAPYTHTHTHTPRQPFSSFLAIFSALFLSLSLSLSLSFVRSPFSFSPYFQYIHEYIRAG